MNGPVVACDSSYISTFRARYVRFSFPGAYLLTSPYVEWRLLLQPVYTADYVTYVQILTWFFDSPSTLCPFSMDRMAFAGKELEKDVGQWYGPSTVAGAIKCVDVAIFAAYILTFLSDLGAKFPSLGISVAVDGQIFQMDVYSASYPPTQSPRPRKPSRWGGRAVVVLICIQLKIDGVNPIYYETVKVCDFPPTFFHVPFDLTSIQ